MLRSFRVQRQAPHHRDLHQRNLLRPTVYSDQLLSQTFPHLLIAMATKPQFLSGDNAAIEEFLSRFDVSPASAPL
jgi:hypothetical protein